ncbi:MAG: type II toxin-antitoxin system RelE/ParE family toxin [Spirochaetes bacterium]|nr:type II toxin-antitoxin system RelE/ParE family toxin [Spirochaetota bacterium]
MVEYIAYKGLCFTIEWYHDAEGRSQPLEYFLCLPDRMQDKTLYLFKRIGDFGKINNKKQFRYEGDEIFAFKPQPYRFLCFFVRGRKIIITNAFMKKSDRLPAQEKTRAMTIRTDYLRRLKDTTYYETK